MGIKKRMALRTARKLAEGMEKEDFLIPLREEVKRKGMEGGVDAAMERIEKSGLKPIFDQLGITREDIEEVFR